LFSFGLLPLLKMDFKLPLFSGFSLISSIVYF
jgi:hypothetical protein